MDEIIIHDMSYKRDIYNVANLALPWEKLSGKNVLVTGATGLIGSSVVEILISRNDLDYNVYALGRSKSRYERLFSKYDGTGKLHFICHDITAPLICDIDFNYIIHAASGANPREYATNPVGVMKSNILGTINLIEYGLNHKLERFLYVSSGEVYGEGDGRAFTEDYSGYIDCATTRACYPSSKRATETLCVSYASQYGIEACIVRPSHIYGPNFTESDNRAYCQFIRNILNNESIVLKSTGEQYRSWCYVVDCASAILYVLLKGLNGNAYNIADDNSNITIKQLAEMIAEIGSKDVVFDLPSEVEQKGFNVVKKSIFDTRKLKGLGWENKGTMLEKIKSTIQEVKNK